jgi:hypothetical protein
VFKQGWGGALVLKRQTLERCSWVEEADVRACSRVQAKLGRGPRVEEAGVGAFLTCWRGRRWSVAHVLKRQALELRSRVER